MRKRQKKKNRKKKVKAYLLFDKMVKEEYSKRQVMMDGFRSFFEPGRAADIVDIFYEDIVTEYTPIFDNELI